ncbi:YciI family protein [Pseudonocardia kujensis]|uniref:YciI family protein n=1 Tax=Pseudonocardia kujensis TaxID=1128675 RepID=UPI001E32B40C|nr:YciI family protein [Pseudonocardia kujensis]MCE0762379.1 YciI family protein [Pseudonocardia kujensis]
MALFAVVWRYTDDTRLLDEIRPLHRDYLQDMVKQGVVRQAGPFRDGSGGLLVYDVADETELAERIGEDPFSVNGVIVESHSWPWTPVVGPLAD